MVNLQSEGDHGDALSEKSIEGSSETVSLLDYFWVDVKLIMGDNSCVVLKECQPMCMSHDSLRV